MFHVVPSLPTNILFTEVKHSPPNFPLKQTHHTFGLHRMHVMHEMQPIATDMRGVCPSVCQFVCLSCSLTGPHNAETAEQIKMLFGVNSLGGPWNIVLYEGSVPPQTERGGPILLNFGTPSYFRNG